MNQLTSVSALLGAAWNDYKSKVKNLALLMAGFYVVMGVIMMIATGGSLATSVAANELAAGVIPFIIGLGVLMVIGIMAEIALIHLAAGTEQSIKQALKRAPQRFWGFLGLAILLSLTVLVGLVLLVIPGLIFIAWFGLSYFVFLLEDKKITEAMKTSKAYVRGRFWPVVWRLLALFVVMLPFWILSGIGGDESMFGFILNAVIGIFVGPCVVVYMYHLYRDLKRTFSPEPAQTA